MPPKRTREAVDDQLGRRASRRGAAVARGRARDAPCAPIAEVALAHLVARRPARRPARERDPADLQHVRASSAMRERHRRVLLDQHDGDALAVDLARSPRRCARRSAARGRATARRAAAARRGHQRARRSRASAARRRRAGRRAAPALAQEREQLVDPGPRARSRPLVARRQAAGAQVLLDGQVAEDAPALGHLHDAGARDRRRGRRRRGCGRRTRSSRRSTARAGRPACPRSRAAACSCRRRWRPAPRPPRPRRTSSETPRSASTPPA